MPSETVHPVLHFIRQIVAKEKAEGKSDAELLDSFVSEHEEASFAAILRRHGPMVLAVCRRLLSNTHDAEDAFQATFLVLVRKAGSSGRPKLLANWLHGVAYNTALKARSRRVSRIRRESPLTDTPEVEAMDEATLHDLRAVLDE